ELAGIDPSDVSVLLDGPIQIPAVLSGTSPVALHGEIYTRFGFGVEVTGSIPDGNYDVVVAVNDRSGNSTVRTIGTLEIIKWIATVTVSTQGLVPTPITRDVVFVATDAGGTILSTVTVPVDFVGGSATVVLAGLPDGTARL